MATYSRKRSLPDDLSQPLTAISANTVTPLNATAASSNNVHKKPRLTQMTLDLGQKVFTKCKTCGMDYVLSSDEDRKLHKKFHEAHVEQQERGIPLTEAARRRGRVVARFRPRIPIPASQGAKKNGLSKFMVAAPAKSRREAQQPKPRSIAEQGKAQDTIIEIKRGDHWTLTHLAERVLVTVEDELGAVHIEAKQLWEWLQHNMTEHYSFSELIHGNPNAPAPEQDLALNMERYRAYLYIHDGRCVGLLLAERIKEGRAVLPPEVKRKEPATFASRSLPTPPPSSPPADEKSTSTTKELSGYATTAPLMASTTTSPALMGISRIWVLSSFRSLGIANMLLETARRKFGHCSALMDETEEVSEAFAAGKVPAMPKADTHRGIETEDGFVPYGFVGHEKSKIAFSQPTDMGRRFAEKWWGQEAGWLVYD